jgi:hypothetical protein
MGAVATLARTAGRGNLAGARRAGPYQASRGGARRPRPDRAGPDRASRGLAR